MLLRALTLFFAVLVAGCTFERRESYDRASVTLADVRVVGSLPVYVAIEKGFFAKYAIDVKLRSSKIGLKALEDMAEGRAEVVTAADVPVTLCILKKQDVRVAATIAISDSNNAMVWRKDRRIDSPADFKGKRVGVTPGTTADYFFDTFLLLHHIPRQAVRRVPLPQDHLVPMLQQGEVDAIATWNPITADAMASLDSNAGKMQMRNFIETFYLLVTTSEMVKNRPQVVKRLLLALRDAAAYIEDHRDEAAVILRKYVPDKNEHPLEGYHYDVTLENAIIVSFLNIAKWAGTSGHRVPEGIEFVSSIYFQGLLSIDPTLVTVLR